MIHFLRRKHLIDWLLQNCTRKTVVRAMEEGTVENLGSFSKLGPVPHRPGWIVLVISERGKVWIVEIVNKPKGFGIFIVDWKENTRDPVPWQHWLGSVKRKLKATQAWYDLYEGDNPEKYARLRDEAMKDERV